jgi:hypothetical protein
LGRTLGELLEGSPAHRPVSSKELQEWEAEYQLRAWEQEQANKSRK